jgi:hypothetical protein
LIPSGIRAGFDNRPSYEFLLIGIEIIIPDNLVELGGKHFIAGSIL